MTTYSFKVTKGKYQLSLTTTDRDMIVEQFELWVKKISDYAKKQKVHNLTNRANTQINAERELTQRKIDEQLKDIRNSQPTEKSQKAAEVIKNDLDVIYDSECHTEENKPVAVQENLSAPQGFDSILDKSMQAPQEELSFKPTPSIKKDNAFLNFISGRKLERKIDYLLMTAYYFTQYEQKPRFTLKQLNAKLMQNVAIIIDHSVVQEAINRDYIECLPDLTGIVGASEYRLTAYGEKTLLEEG
mgnify:CR=1 FL=1